MNGLLQAIEMDDVSSVKRIDTESFGIDWLSEGILELALSKPLVSQYVMSVAMSDILCYAIEQGDLQTIDSILESGEPLGLWINHIRDLETAKHLVEVHKATTDDDDEWYLNDVNADTILYLLKKNILSIEEVAFIHARMSENPQIAIALESIRDLVEQRYRVLLDSHKRKPYYDDLLMDFGEHVGDLKYDLEQDIDEYRFD